MRKPQHTAVDELVSGLQLPVFEIIWPAFRWIRSIWIKESKGEFQVFAEVNAPQDKKRLERFEYLMREMFDEGEELLDELEPSSKHTIRFAVQYGPAVPKDLGYQEMMSDRVFKKIAKKRAPWRLENGR
jgi:hypothetical protein